MEPGTSVVGNTPFHRSAWISATRFGLAASASPLALMALASALPRNVVASACACASARIEFARPVACVTAISALILSCANSCWRCWTATSACMRASTERM